MRVLVLFVCLLIVGCGDNGSVVEPELEEDLVSQPLYSIQTTETVTITTFYVNDDGQLVILIPAEEVAEVLQDYLDPLDTIDRTSPKITG